MSRISIGELWIGLAQMYGKDISKPSMSIMLNAISDLDSRAVEKVLNEWAKTSKLGRHPFPAEIREKINPQLNSKDLARDTSMRVVQAVQKFGYTQPEEAETFIGPAGWVAVKRWGGWKYICEGLGVTLDVTTFAAQLRDLLESQVNLERSGVDLNKPAIEQSKKEELDNPEGQRRIAQLLNLNKTKEMK